MTRTTFARHAPQANDAPALPHQTPREFERFLRSASYSRKASEIIISKGYRAAADWQRGAPVSIFQRLRARVAALFR